MYTQTLCSIVPTQADYAAARSKFSALKDTNVNGTLANQIGRMLDNIDTLSGPGSAKKLLDGVGVKASDIANLSADDRVRLSEKVTNRYMSAIKEAAGDTAGGFADIYGNYRVDSVNGDASVSEPGAATTTVASAGTGPALNPGDAASSAVAPQAPDPATALVDLLVRSMGLEVHNKPPEV